MMARVAMMWLMADVTGHLPNLMAGNITYHNQRSFRNKMQIETSLDQKYWQDKLLKIIIAPAESQFLERL